MTASYLAEEPLFKIGRRKIRVKPRTKEFLSTHTVGDTAFYSFPIPKEPKAPTTDILGQWVQGPRHAPGRTCVAHFRFYQDG